MKEGIRPWIGRMWKGECGMRSKRKNTQVCVILCLLTCLLFCGCTQKRENKESNANAASSETGATAQAIDTQLAKLQSKLEEIELRYRDLQKKAEQYAQGGESPPTGSEEVAHPIPPTSQETAQYLYRQENEGVVLTKYFGEAREVTVPGAIDGMRVIGLADSAFAGTAVQCVVLPDTLRSLGWFTFYGCSSLEKVIIPASVEKIGYASFDGCSSTLTLTVEKGSYAQQYAASFALRYTVS